MVESIVAISVLGHNSICKSYCSKDVVLSKRDIHMIGFCRLSKVVPSKSSRRSAGCRIGPLIKSEAIELTREANLYRDGGEVDKGMRYMIDSKTFNWKPKSKADDPRIHNPLIRHERMGSGWLGAIFEWEGVLVEDNTELENQAWLALSQEEGKLPPQGWILRRIEGMKNEQAISEVLCWSRDLNQVKRMSTRKEEIYQAFQGGVYRFLAGSKEFVNILMHNNIPRALISTRPRKILENMIDAIGIEGFFNVIVAAEDVYSGKPDPEMFVYAAELLQFIPERCIVFGNSNQTVEAAHDARMKCVAVASKHPVYELGAADLVVRHLDELTVVDLKNLAALDSAEFCSGEPELQMEAEEEHDPYSRSSVAVDDGFW